MEFKEEQFLDLVETNKARLMRICRIYARARSDQEDLFQEVLINAWQSIDRFEGRSSVHTWLYRLALNVAMRYRSREKKAERLRKVTPPNWLTYRPSVEYDLEKKERIEQLYRAVGELKGIDQQLILMNLEELSYQEMAEVTGLTESNVGVRLNRARKKLSALLRKKIG